MASEEVPDESKGQSLVERLDKIKSPKLQNQRETAVVLSAVEETLKDQNYGKTPTGYFAALLALLGQSLSSSGGLVNKELATSVAYLLDIVSTYVPAPLLRSKFSQILTSLGPVLTQSDIEAPLIRSSIGCLESLLLAQDGPAWALPQSEIGPRRAVAGLLVLAADHRPKVRKRAQEAINHVLQQPPPSPSLDHPVIDMCAETALRSVNEAAVLSGKKGKKSKAQRHEEHQPATMHALQLIKAIASASGGWPSKKLESLCEVLMQISRSQNEYLTMMAFEIFEIVFAGMTDEVSSAKLPHLLAAITELRPSQNDSQLLPPWIAIISRGYDVSAQVMPEETFQKLPDIFSMIAEFCSSSSHNIRISASECLISFLVNCIPDSAILEPSVYDEKTLEKLSSIASDLISLKYQSAWMEVFNVLSALFSAFKWRSVGLLNPILTSVGELRANDAFTGKKEADAVLGKAVEAMGPETVLSLLPLNLAKPITGQPGRAWLLPVLRDHIHSANLGHFKSEFVPLSEIMFQKVLDHGSKEKTMEVKIFETLVQQIWALLPGYCTTPLDVSEAFDQKFAEMLANLLYSQTNLRPDICKALQNLVASLQAVMESEGSENDLFLYQRLSKEDARKGLEHLASFAGNLLAVLFNVYSQTLPQYRGYILQCINCYLGVTPEKERIETFERVCSMLENALQDSPPENGNQGQQSKGQLSMPPASHTLTDLMITLSPHLPRSAFPALFTLAARLLPLTSDPQLQKKAYKLLPRLASSESGAAAVVERSSQLQTLLLETSASASAPSRRDRLAAISAVVEHLPSSDLHFIPSILSEVVLSAKEVNEKARTQAFDLLVLMAQKMQDGGIVIQARVPNMGPDAPEVNANLEEFFTMVSAGLAGGTPHVVSASITALTRILYEYAAELQRAVIEDLVQTMEVFLTSANREIVRSVLGFVKVAVISLPEDMMKPRLQQLVPGLMNWSREHKARFRSKVKHIFERIMRRFGAEEVEKWCPEDDKKFLHNIRKTKERNKRHKAAANANENSASTGEASTNRPGFNSAFDDAIYASESSSSDSDSGASETNESSHPKGQKSKSKSKFKSSDPEESSSNRGTYISNPASHDPLDLLSQSTLAHISSRRPLPSQANKDKTKRKARTDTDGKLVFHDLDSQPRKTSKRPTTDADAMDLDSTPHLNDPNLSLEEGINAYVSAISGRDAVQRGRGGRLKFSNRRNDKSGSRFDTDNEDGEGDDGDYHDGDAGAGKPAAKKVRFAAQNNGKSRAGTGAGRGGIIKRVDRKGLGVGKHQSKSQSQPGGQGGRKNTGRGRGEGVQGGRVGKSGRW